MTITVFLVKCKYQRTYTHIIKKHIDEKGDHIIILGSELKSVIICQVVWDKYEGS